MSFDLHTVAVFAGAPAWSDRLRVGLLPGQPYPAAGGAGASVALNVQVPGMPPAAIVVPVAIGADATVSISGKSAMGFTATISPRLASETLAAGAVDFLVVG